MSGDLSRTQKEATTVNLQYTKGTRSTWHGAGLLLAAAGMMAVGALPVRAQGTPAWDKTFPKSEHITHQKVTFKN